MRRNVLVFGLICGLIVWILMLIPLSISYNNDKMIDTSVWLGYASMIIAFSMIFVGIKNYRDKYNNGFVSFGKAFTIGLLITLIASTIYVITWQIEYHYFFPGYMDRYFMHELAKVQSSGMSQQKIDKETAEMLKMQEMTKNPVLNILFTYLEVLPIGLIVSLICAGILKRKNKPVQMA